MSRPLSLGLTAMLFAFTFVALPVRAAESATAPAAAEQKAPCPGMPGGGCCGSAECKQDGAMAAAGDAAPGEKALGCPCQRARAAAAKAAAEEAQKAQ
ncbi:MAG: hypothetical protein ACRERC_27465 [Candidatus Binatia bacterium]